MQKIRFKIKPIPTAITDDNKHSSAIHLASLFLKTMHKIIEIRQKKSIQTQILPNILYNTL